MKAVKITAANVPAITGALASVNGKSGAHTLTYGHSVVEIAMGFEQKLIALVGSKKLAPGAKATYVSGSALPSAYKYARTVARIEMERRASAWFLMAVVSAMAYREAGPEYLTLTAEQDTAAVAKFRKGYRK